MKIGMIIFCLVMSNLSFAGTWGILAFENDSAQDWYLDVSSSLTPNEDINRALSLEPNAFVESYECEMALAASELLASKLDGDLNAIPFKNNIWVTSGKIEANDAKIELAIIALNRCLNISNSELAVLWSESSMYKEFKVGVEKLLNRLQR
ncbi:DUF4259 domain-containing protein [Enterovibrio norvegicus]|uniref:DUF4259 domain-containing protein n=1 Tax=Enterovibrio norvegicus TaxID=188144 RepID=UPI00352D4471